MTTRIIPGRELAKALGLTKAGLQELGSRRRLPFGVSAAYGMFVHWLDVPAWRSAAQSERGNGMLDLDEAIEKA
jgi:hypothetical protein